MTARERPFLIAVDGLSGAGKTTLTVELAALLRPHLSVHVFHLEDIYPGWDGLEQGMERYVRQVLRPLSAGSTAAWRAWDWEADDDGPERRSEPADVVFLEGVGAACSAARPYLDAVIWIEAADELRRQKALARDGGTYEPFWNRWAAQEAQWLADDDVRAPADITVEGHHGRGTPALVLNALAGLPSLARALGQLPRTALSLHVEQLSLRADAPAIFAALYSESPRAVWLDSSNSGELADRNRFSILADDDGGFGRFARHDNGVTTMSSGPVTVRIREPFFRWLSTVWGSPQVEVPESYPCEFALGWLGYLGYELKRETGGADTTGPSGSPDACLLFAGRAVVLDHQENQVYLLTLGSDGIDGGTGDGDTNRDDDMKSWLAAARQAVRAQDDDPQNVQPSAAGTLPPHTGFSVRDSRAAYLERIDAAKDQIREGNSYEVCLTTELTASSGHLEPLQIYSSLRHRSPAPFANYLRFKNLHIAGSSPERFLAITSAGALRAEPIKGTRRRRPDDPEADAALRKELALSAKDRAENIMIVDLLRNDLSHFAVPGTLAVSRLCDVESYATVHQMVSTIDAQLRPGASRAEAIAAAFPAGSMTGAPKISTMAILDRLETGPRGVYSGAVGFLSLSGAVELSVVIRTLVMRQHGSEQWDLSLGVGGAITADSVPAEEWEEIRTKARGVLLALGAEFPQDL